ncbi:CopD family copper resistance protein [Stutzerimonas urumqiensis]|uniref:CopD family copper resistance protein n=1 Tax=Stutzerimonas urumqiensis TaxID=638269 RepID=UPI000EACA839|nr:hypothetical protein [Stutzerimonas urumqiensis]
MTYSLLHLLHLLGAIAFIGTMFFQVVIFGKVKQQLGEQAVEPVEKAIGARSRKVLHWVVLLVYGAGLGLAWRHRHLLANPLASAFGTLLTLKIVLAVAVFVSFGLVAMLLRRGRMTPARYRRLQWAVLAQMLGIVVLAKAMFYLSW